MHLRPGRRDSGARRTRGSSLLTAPGFVLFLCLFTSQAGMLVLSPILPEIAREFGVSTATAGQLRSISGLTGGLTAIAIAIARRRPGLRDLLTGGAALVALGSAEGEVEWFTKASVCWATASPPSFR